MSEPDAANPSAETRNLQRQERRDRNRVPTAAHTRNGKDDVQAHLLRPCRDRRARRAISCDKVPLLAPTNSTVTIDAGSRVVPTGGTTEVTAIVIESSGTPVQNGTLVRFTTTLGRLDPVEAQTRNGIAVTTFFAGNDSGIAEVHATSGGAGGSTTTNTRNRDHPGTTTPPRTATSC